MSSTTSHIFVVWAPDDEAPGTFEKRMSVREEHAARAKSDPTVRLAGPMLSPESVTGGERKLIGSMFLIEATKLEEVREKMEQDVYWRTGVWDKSKLTILPYLPVLGTTKVV
ncbi:hypothetical protein FS837_007657 [Tulasnella sp. UAMH 9824]|nr:hypothetical protein FRC00_003696 [Tulasnella sp. 408]KAG9044715.1 hypothetical protein FS837_007657 [Tulasnella sp. UAMH 9824]